MFLFRGFWRGRLPGRRHVVYGVAVILSLWFLGILDHLFETPFDEFRWPGNGPVFDQVSLELYEKQSNLVYVQPLSLFSNVKTPTCEKMILRNESLLYIIVKSAISNKQSREAIRRTWGKRQRFVGWYVFTIFMVAQADGFSTEGEIDVIVGDFKDTYRNNTKKFIHSLLWSRGDETGKGCPAAHFTLLVDDDYMVNVPLLLSRLKNVSPDSDLYEGWRFDTNPFRFKLHKHSVRLSEYIYDAYPPYISAGAVLLSLVTVKKMALAVQHVQMYKFDDVYAGILAYCLRIEPRHDERYIFWERSIANSEWSHIIAAHGFDANKMLKTWVNMNGF